MKRNLIAFIIFLLPLTAIQSCQKDAVNRNKTEEINVTVSVKTPTTPYTYSSVEIEENKINDVYLFFFKSDDNTISFASEGTLKIVDSQPINEKTFETSFNVSSENREKDHYAYVITNIKTFMTSGTTKLSDFTGLTYDQLLGLLNKPVTASDIITDGIVMWGKTTTFKPSDGTIIMGIKAIRSLAKIEVGVGEYSVDTWVPGSIPFVLRSVSVFRAQNQLSFMPSSDAFIIEPTSGEISITKPTVVGTASEISAPWLYNISTGDNFIREKIYIPEADVKMSPTGELFDTEHTNRAAIVVGGYYNNDESAQTYYRIDFRSGETVKTLTDILRNNLYRINITGVKAAGFSNAEAAYRAKASTITAEITSWEEQNEDVYIDGAHFVHLEKTHVYLPGSIHSTEMSEIKSFINISTDTAPSEWLMRFKGVGINEEYSNAEEIGIETANINANFVFSRPLNNTVATSDGRYTGTFSVYPKSKLSAGQPNKEAIVQVKIGRIVFEITITQKASISEDWENGGEDNPEL